MTYVWIPVTCVTLIGLASLIIGAVSWIRRNPRPRYAPGQPPGGWSPPTASATAQAGLRQMAQTVPESDWDPIGPNPRVVEVLPVTKPVRPPMPEPEPPEAEAAPREPEKTQEGFSGRHTRKG